MSKVKFLVSFAFALCLVLACGTCAFADENPFGDTLGEVSGTLDYNYGTVITNKGTIVTNEYNGGALARINDNYGTVTNNKGYIETNHNTGTVVDHYSGNTPPPVVVYNYGSVSADSKYSKSETGSVVYNFYGNVSENIEIYFDYHKLTSNLSLAELQGLLTAVHWRDKDNNDGVTNFVEIQVASSGQPKEYYAANILMPVDDAAKPFFYILDETGLNIQIPENYALRINYTGDNFIGKTSITDVNGDIYLEFTPINDGEAGPVGPGQGVPGVAEPAKSYSVPATGDMSNMPLWGALLIGFAALAIATRKKKA